MMKTELLAVTHGFFRGEASEKLYYPGGEPPGYPTSYRVWGDTPLHRDLALADCPTLEAAQAARRLLEGDP